MSFFRFFGKKKSKDEMVVTGIRDPEMEQEEERRKLRHSLSVSRSGRFKQKKKERSGFLDKPDLFDTNNHGGESTPEDSPSRRHPEPGRSGDAAGGVAASGRSDGQSGQARTGDGRSRQGDSSGRGNQSVNSQSGQNGGSRQGAQPGPGKPAAASSQLGQGQGRSPNNSCRELNGRIIPGGLRIGQQGVAS